MTNAAITPGIHPHNVSKNTMRTDPQPWSNTAKGGKMIDKMTLSNDMTFFCKNNIFFALKMCGKIIKFVAIFYQEIFV